MRHTSAHKLLKPIILIIVTLLPHGCKVPDDSPLLRAESFLEEHPDSAAMVMNELDGKQFHRRSEKALYGLLSTA
ncbi:MAG: hypothetical protein NC221_04910, partial [Duncaniella sp.]|nr:hypothetical protein [Duncaniella sp.]